ncbi:MAG: DUF302 domain-containing protein [Thiohalospira sp.]
MMKPMTRIAAPLLAVAALLLAGTAAAAQEPVKKTEHMVVYQYEESFDFALEAVEMAITGRGMVINNTAHIAEMLARTADDVGGEAVYEKGQALEFCSATVSRATMEADIHNIVFCPYIIAVYTVADEPGQVYLAYRRPPRVGDEESRAALGDVEELLDELVQEAMAF